MSSILFIKRNDIVILHLAIVSQKHIYNRIIRYDSCHFYLSVLMLLIDLFILEDFISGTDHGFLFIPFLLNGQMQPPVSHTILAKYMPKL